MTVHRYRYFYRPQRSCGQGNVFTGECLSTGGEGVCLSACWDAIPPLPARETPPGPGRPPPVPGRHPPGPGRPPRDQADPPQDQADPPRPGRPPRTRKTPWDQADPPGPGRHPPPPGSRLQHTVYERPVRMLLECILVAIFYL